MRLDGLFDSLTFDWPFPSTSLCSLREFVAPTAAACASDDLAQAQTHFTDERFAVPKTTTSFIEGIPAKNHLA